MSWKYKYILAFVPLAMPIFSANADSSISALEKEKLDRVHNNIRPFEVDDNMNFDYYDAASSIYNRDGGLHKDSINREKINIPKSEVIDYSSVANNYSRSSMAFYNMTNKFNFINYSDLIDGKGFNIDKGYAYAYFDYNYKKLFYNYTSMCYYYKEFSKKYYDMECSGNLSEKQLEELKSKKEADVIEYKIYPFAVLNIKVDVLRLKIDHAMRINKTPLEIKNLIDDSYFEYFGYYKKSLEYLKENNFKDLYNHAKARHDKFKSVPYQNYRYIIEQTGTNFDDHER